MTENSNKRLGDCILTALTLALEQKDAAIADLLGGALEMSLTRNAGGKDFTERRDFPPHIQKAFLNLDALRKATRN